MLWLALGWSGSRCCPGISRRRAGSRCGPGRLARRRRGGSALGARPGSAASRGCAGPGAAAVLAGDAARPAPRASAIGDGFVWCWRRRAGLLALAKASPSITRLGLRCLETLIGAAGPKQAGMGYGAFLAGAGVADAPLPWARRRGVCRGDAFTVVGDRARARR